MKLLILPLLLAVAPIPTNADPRDDYHSREKPRVTVYQNADFRGASLTFYPGDTVDNFAGRGFEDGGSINDRISSIRIEGDAEVLVYEDSRYRGRVLRLTDSERNLAGRLLPESVGASWNDRISSLRIEIRQGGGRGDGRLSRAKADEIIRNAFRDLLGRDPDLTGPVLFRDLILTQGWTEQMVRDNIRRGEEFRLQGADRVVRLAYLEVLDREPDPADMALYRNRVLQSNWSGRDVRDALLGSDEYRRKSSGQIVRHQTTSRRAE